MPENPTCSEHGQEGSACVYDRDNNMTTVSCNPMIETSEETVDQYLTDECAEYKAMLYCQILGPP